VLVFTLLLRSVFPPLDLPSNRPRALTCTVSDFEHACLFDKLYHFCEISMPASSQYPYSCISRCRPPLFLASPLFYLLFASLFMVLTDEVRKRAIAVNVPLPPVPKPRRKRHEINILIGNDRDNTELASLRRRMHDRVHPFRNICMNTWSSTPSNNYPVPVLLTTASSNAGLPSLHPFLRAPLPRRTIIE
jgi:hypothetical protein